MDRPAEIVSRVDTAAPRLRARHASGARVTLADGHEYIDLMNGKGCVTLGHHHPAVADAIRRVLDERIGCSTCWSDAHEELAATIVADSGMPEAQLAFFSTGTEACRVAVQAARSRTGRRLVASAGYHGWGDHWDPGAALLAPNANGVIDFYFIPELLDEVLRRHAGQVALMILSPDYVHLLPATLAELVGIARAHGVLVCCDDVKQGYRSTPASALPRTAGVDADLYTFAKGLANGQRLSCVVGRPEVMAAVRHLTYTAYFDIVPIVAGLATLKEMARTNGYDRLVACGAAVAERLRREVAQSGLPIAVYGDGPMLQLAGATEELDAALYAACAHAGLLLYEGDNQSVSLATESEVDEIGRRFAAALAVLATSFDHLAGQDVPPQRRFEAAFAMMDGATDAVPRADALRWLEGMR